MQRIRWRALGAASIGTVLIDRTVTLWFWAYESNPLVTWLGASQWLALTGIVLTLLLIMIESERLAVWQSVGAWVMLGGLTALHVIVTMANLAGLWAAGVVTV